MDRIKKLNFGIVNNQKTEKPAKEEKRLPVVAENTGKVDSALRKLGTYAATLLLAATSLTSCQNQEVNFDDDKLFEFLDKFMEKLLDKYDRDHEDMLKVIALLEKNNKDNETIISIVNKATDGIDKVQTTLNDIDKNVIDINQGVQNLVDYARLKYANDKELLQKISNIENSNMKQEEKLDKLAELITETNQIMLGVGQLITDTGSDLGAKIEKFYNQYSSTSMTQSQLLEAILNEIKDAKEITKYDNAEFKALITKLLNSSMDNGDKLIGISNSINALNTTMTNIETLIGKVDQKLGVYGKEISSKITKLNNDYKMGNMTEVQMLFGIYNELINSNKLSSKQVSQLDAIFNAIQTADANSVEGMQKLAEASSKILDVLNIMRTEFEAILDLVSDIASDTKTLTAGQKETNKNILKFIDEYKAGNESTNSLLLEVIAELAKLNGTVGTMAKDLEQLQKDVQNGIISDAEAHQQLARLLAGIKANTQFQNQIGIKTLDKLSDIEAAINNGTMSVEDGMTAIANLLKQIQASVDSLTSEVQTLSGNVISLANTINNNNKQANQYLKGIFDNTVDIKKGVNNIKDTEQNVFKNIVNLSGKADVIINKLGELPGTSFTKSDLDEILGKYYNKVEPYLKKGGTQMDQVNNNLQTLIAQGKKQLTQEQLHVELGDLYNRVAQLLKNPSSPQVDLSEVVDAINSLKSELKPGELDLSDVIAAINASRADLTKTNSLIEHVANILQNMDLGGASAGDYSSLVAKMNELIAHGDANAEAAHKDYLDIIKLLASIDGGVQALQASAKTIVANQQTAANDYRKYFSQSLEKMDDILAAIKAGSMGDMSDLKAELIAFKNQAKAANIEQEKANQQIIALLQAAVDKEYPTGGGSGSGSGITINQLENLMKKYLPNMADYSGILNDIKNEIAKLGKTVVTSNDLQNFFLKTQPDLTKTNALIENLTNAVQNLDVSGGSSDFSRIEALLADIQSTIRSQKNPTEAQIQDLTNAINNLSKTAKSRAVAEGMFYVGSHMY